MNLGRHRLAAIAVPAVAAFVGREMMVHLGIQRPLCHGFLQSIQQAIGIKSRFGVGSGQELVQKFVRNMRGFASGHLGASFASILSDPHEIPDRPPTDGGDELHEATLPAAVPKTPLCALDVVSGHSAQVSIDRARAEPGDSAQDMLEAHGDMKPVQHDSRARQHGPLKVPQIGVTIR
jgi:hypothetical protein